MAKALKYPVLLVHGMGFRDYRRPYYWGRIPKKLEEAGCKVFFGNTDSNGEISANGENLARRIDEILRETGAEKVNIIAHSKGGLDSRYAISVLGMGDKVASLTTLSTPHHGSKTVDVLLRFPDFIVKAGCFFVDLWFRVLGDKKPATYKVIHSFKTSAAADFNEKVLDAEGVYYSSYAFVMKKPTSDILMALQNAFVGIFEGENDGLLTPEAVKWGEFKGVHTGTGRRGISHCDEIDLRRRPLSKEKGDAVSDIVDVYLEIVQELAERGF